MKLEIVGTNIATPAMPPSANGSFRNSNRVLRRPFPINVFFYMLLLQWTKEGEVHWEGFEVAVGAEAMNLEGAMDWDEVEVIRYLQKILMHIWRNITQRQCRSIEGILMLIPSLFTPYIANLCA